MVDQNEIHKTQERLKKTLLFTLNVSFDEFAILLPRMLATSCIGHYEKAHWDKYAKLHWYKMQDDPARWLLDLDSEARERFIQAALDKYGD